MTGENSFVNKKPKNEVVEAKIILLGDSGVGKSSIG
jgi:small GTP-binding protein